VNVDLIATPMAQQWRTRSHAQFEHIRRRLRWQMLLAYVTPLLILAAFFHYQYTDTIKQGIDNHLKSIAENQRNTVDLFLKERVSNLRNVAGEGSCDIPPSAGQMDRILSALRSESPTFVDVGLFSPDGTLAAYSGPHPQLEGKSYRDEAWWRKIHDEESDTLLSDVYLGFRGKPHFIIALRRSVGGGAWILRASVDPEKFGEFVGSHHLTAEAETLIVNPRGERQTIAQGQASDERVAVPPRSGEAVVDDMDGDGRRYLAAFSWLTETDWCIVVRVPAGIAYAPLLRARIILASLMLLTIAALVLVVMRSTTRIVARLEESDIAKANLRGQLFNAAKLASVGEMAAGVAHEINNPLAIIYEEAGIMRDMMDPEIGGKVDLEDFRERLGAIGEAAMRGRTITRKLMAFARQHDPVLEPTDILAVIDKIVAIKDVEFRVNDIEVLKDYAENLPRVMINANQMEQVLLNLLNNARDAMAGTRGRVRIATRLVDGEVHIDIEDTGCGMTADQIEKAFFPFFTTKDVGKGTGLGLSISYGIIKSFEGRIEVQSAVGAGTTLTIVLPVDAGRKAARESEGGRETNA